ncbi:MAG: YitT family protein [Bacteroidaceae bacterium]|jgi:uncharacterized membrane-anchored protein YitT (DUF2179 family)
MWSYVKQTGSPSQKYQFIWNEIRDYFVITVGIFSYALGWVLFFIPYKITIGGVAGIGAITFYATGIPMQVTYFVINLALMIVALKYLGMRFVIRTSYGILMMTFALWILQENISPTLSLLGEGQDFLACTLGSVMCGFGLAIIFMHNGSTGGTDIIAAAINKYRDISLGRMILYCDIIIIASCYFVFNDWRRVLFGYVATFIYTFTLDSVTNRNQQSVQFLIFSEKYAEIADVISVKLHRGVTVLDGQGWYSKRPVKVLCILAKRKEAVSILRMVKSIDEHAFLSESNVHGVFGKGFDRIKVK